MKILSDDIRRAAPFVAFLDDLGSLGIEPVAQGGQSYAVIAARSNQRWWLIPLDNRRAAAAGLEMMQPVTPVARMAKAGARAVARFGPHVLLGKGKAANISHARRRKAGRVRLHRDVLQPDTQAHEQRHAVTS